MKKYLFLIVIFFFSLSCSKPEYVVSGGKVYYKFWSFDLGGENQWLVEKSDNETFETIGYYKSHIYGKDKNYIYCKNKIIKGADPKSFTFLSEGYSKDSKTAFRFMDSICESKGFEIIDREYSKNIDDVYYKSCPLKVCDPEKFRLVFENEKSYFKWTTDSVNYFKGTIKIPLTDYENIKVFENYNISMNNEEVYYLDRKLLPVTIDKYIPPIDIETFEIISDNNYKDKYGKINNSGRVFQKK